MPERILIVDDNKEISTLLETLLHEEGFSTLIADNGEEAKQMLNSNKVDLVISDIIMPELNGRELLGYIKEHFVKIPVILITAYGTIRDAVDMVKEGAFDYIQKPFDIDELVKKVKVALRVKKVDTDGKDNENKIIAESRAMRDILNTVEIIAKTDASIMLLGETGVGKEIVARLIHKVSKRQGDFVPVHCAAVPKDLFESELFGHRKGAFTGAIETTKGLLELADKGTLFLDEIGEIPLSFQVKLLRFLDTFIVRPVGGVKEKKIDLRIITATNKKLEHLINEEEFREDLFYRLSVVRIVIPPLRKRKKDIIPLAQHFIRYFNAKYGKNCVIDESVLENMVNYSWPGNIRELKHRLESAILLSQKDTLTVKDIFNDEIVISSLQGLKQAKEKFEKDYLVNLLTLVKGNVSKASKLSGKDRKNLYLLFKKYGINPDEFK